MPSLLSKPSRGDICTQDITPESANWDYVGFSSYDMKAGDQLQLNSSDKELCLVLVSGRADINTEQQQWRNVGERNSPFEDRAPYAVYVPPGENIVVDANTSLELAVCSAPAEGLYPARLIEPSDCRVETRGEGSNQRRICNILFDNARAEKLLVCEVVTPSGNWSSYPPHKHDTDDVPNETYLEETYYHRLNPPQGFAFQRVYTDERDIDETMSVEDRCVVMVPRGYHPVGVPHGYESYYLNVMAGPKRQWIFHNDPDHEWMLETAN